MRALPEEFEATELVGCLSDGWGFDVVAAEYAAVGGGSYHWVVRERDGRHGFVTLDDLDRKPWLGATRQSVFEGLSRAFATAASLREGGLDFVVAPISTTTGEAVRRIGPRYSIALFPFVDGTPGRFGGYDTAERAAIATMLAQLHQAPADSSVAPIIDLDPPGRGHLESALRELEDVWRGGPFSEPARQALYPHASDVAELLTLSGRLATDLSSRGTEWVVTHGEPHAANMMRTDHGHVLVDWDTVALAPPERDLWMLVGGADQVTAYTKATGRQLEDEALRFFRLRWDLADLAAFTDLLRSPHSHNADTAKAYDGLTYCLTIRERWPTLLG